MWEATQRQWGRFRGPMLGPPSLPGQDLAPDQAPGASTMAAPPPFQLSEQGWAPLSPTANFCHSKIPEPLPLRPTSDETGICVTRNCLLEMRSRFVMVGGDHGSSITWKLWGEVDPRNQLG